MNKQTIYDNHDELGTRICAQININIILKNYYTLNKKKVVDVDKMFKKWHEENDEFQWNQKSKVM